MLQLLYLNKPGYTRHLTIRPLIIDSFYCLFLSFDLSFRSFYLSLFIRYPFICVVHSIYHSFILFVSIYHSFLLSVVLSFCHWFVLSYILSTIPSILFCVCRSLCLSVVYSLFCSIDFSVILLIILSFSILSIIYDLLLKNNKKMSPFVKNIWFEI